MRFSGSDVVFGHGSGDTDDDSTQGNSARDCDCSVTGLDTEDLGKTGEENRELGLEVGNYELGQLRRSENFGGSPWRAALVVYGHVSLS